MLLKDKSESRNKPDWDSPESSHVRFSPVRIDKFVILSLFTFGLYEVVWLYRNWRYVQESEGNSAIMPFFRAAVAPFYYHSLLNRLQFLGKREKAGLAAAFFFLVASWRLPDPYGLVSSLSFLPLLPAVKAINLKNSESWTQVPSFGWRRRSVAALTLGLPWFALVSIGYFGPPTAVVSGDAMRASDDRYLRETGLLEVGEEILYFYSPGLLSIHGEGAFASDLGVTSYWTELITDDLAFTSLPYSKIVDTEIVYASHPLELTEVLLKGDGDVSLYFVLSAEAGGDRLFMEEVERRRLDGS